MIQRIQSIYLVLVSLLSVSLFFLPVSIKIIPANTSLNIPEDTFYKMDLYGVTKFETNKPVSVTNDYFLLLINAATAAISAAVVFLYRNRKVQIKFCRLLLLLTAAFIVIDFYYSEAIGKEYVSDVNVVYQAGSYFPILQIILVILAIKTIKKDEKLIQSADRIR